MDHREQLPIGAELVGDYRIDGVLGQGGFGITYKATDLMLGKTVAIKEYFPTEFATRDNTLTIRPKSERHGDMFDWGRRRFLEEAQTLAKFEHPAIVRVHRFFEALNTGYMVLEFEDGKSLKCWCDDLGRPATQAELDGIVPPLLDALGVMHAANFIHRDIALDNIIIRPDGSPVLLDFGAARQAIAVETKTLTGIIKAGYSPPEQYLTDASLQGPWTDAYALGATLYRVVTGADPPEAPARQIKETYVPAASASQGEYRPAFLSALDWSLKLKIEDRPQSVSAFQEALSGEQAALETVATSEPVNGKRRTSAMASVSPTSRAAQRSRVTALRWAAVVGAMIILGTGGYSVYQRLDAERQRVDALAIARAERVAQMAREAAEAERKKRAEAERRRREAERRRVQEEKRRKAEALRLADEEAWKHATTPPITIAKLRAYLVQNPHGNYHDAAQAKISTILKKSERDVADCSQNNDIDRAIVGCTSLLRTAVDRLDPKNRARIYNTRGSAYGKKKQYDRAIADLTKSIELDPGLAWAHYNRGTVYQMKGLHDLAIADFTQAIQLNPRFALAYNNRGVAYRKKGKRRRAVADYRKALQIDPSYQFAMHNLKLLGVRP